MMIQNYRLLLFSNCYRVISTIQSFCDDITAKFGVMAIIRPVLCIEKEERCSYLQFPMVVLMDDFPSVFTTWYMLREDCTLFQLVPYYVESCSSYIRGSDLVLLVEMG